MKEDTGATRSSFSRIDIGRSLSIGKPTRSSSTTPSIPAQPASTPSDQSADAAKVSLSAIFDGLNDGTPTPQAGQQISESPTQSVPTPSASSREAAKASYLGQGARAATGVSSPEQTVPSGQVPPVEPARSREIVVEDGEVLSDVLSRIQLKLNEYEVSESDEAPAGDSQETLEPFAQKYVDFLEQTGQQFSAGEREKKVAEVISFYSAPTRQGRLQALVQDV